MLSNYILDSRIRNEFIEKYGTNSTSNVTFDNTFDKVIQEQIKLHTTFGSDEYYSMFNAIKDNHENMYNNIVIYLYDIIISEFNNSYFIDISEDDYVLHYICDKCYQNQEQINLIIKYYTKSFTLNDFKTKIDNIIFEEYEKLKLFIYSDECDTESYKFFSEYFIDSRFFSLYFLNINEYKKLSDEILQSLYTSCLNEKICDIIRNDENINNVITKNVRKNIFDYIYENVQKIIDIQKSPYDGDIFESGDFRNFCNYMKEYIHEIFITYIIFSNENDIDYTNEKIIHLLKNKLNSIAYEMYDFESLYREYDYAENVLSSARDSTDIFCGNSGVSKYGYEINNIKKERDSIINKLFENI
jgi:hypothetical protein